MKYIGNLLDGMDHKSMLEAVLTGIIESHWRTEVDYDCYHESCDERYLESLDKLFDYIFGETEQLGFTWDAYNKLKADYLKNKQTFNQDE